MKAARIKSCEDLNIKGRRALYLSWAEQMLADKLAKYNREVQFNEVYSYEVVEETEKAVKLRVDNIFKFTRGGQDFENCKPWDIWMPKSAVVEMDRIISCVPASAAIDF